MEDHGYLNTNTGGGERKKRNVAVIILAALLALSGFVNIIFFISIISFAFMSGEVSPDGLTEVVIDGSGGSSSRILMLRIEGVISRSGFSQKEPNVVSYVRKRLKRVRAAGSGYTGVLLSVNSPGGGISESDEIHTMLKELKDETGLPVVAYFDGLAASGGYYISAGCDEIIAQPTAITGSIGVIMQLVHFDELMNKAGIESNVIISEKTPFKDIGSPFRKMRDDERAKLREMVDTMYERFVDVVTEGRKDLSRVEVGDIATGMIYTGEDALKLKLVDEVGYFDAAASKIRKLSGTPGADIVELRSPLGLVESLIQGKTTIQFSMFPLDEYLKLKNGQPMYLWVPGSGN